MVPEVPLACTPTHTHKTKERQMAIFRRIFEVIMAPEDGQVTTGLQMQSSQEPLSYVALHTLPQAITREEEMLQP